MNKSLEDWYKATQKLIKDAYATGDNSEYLKDAVDEWVAALKAIDESCPGVKEKCERDKSLQESFTPEQIDFICYQIGDWYLDWKNRIVVDGKEGQHRLGVAKEHLKTMICGD